MDAVAANKTGRRIAAPILSGLALALAFPPLGGWSLAWFALVPWYLGLGKALAPRGVRASFLSGFLLGLTLFLVGMVWMNEIGALPWIVLALIQAIPFALLGAICAALLPRLPAGARPWVFAALWTLFEGLRSWGRYAFPWFLLAATQVRVPALVQIVAVTGQWGLTFAIAAASGLLGEAWRYRGMGETRAARRFALAALAIPVVLGVGGALALRGEDGGAARRVGVVQGNVLKAGGSNYAADTLRRYLTLSRDAAEAMEATDERGTKAAFIAWPETVVPGALLGDPSLLAAIAGLARELQTPLLVGTVTDEGGAERWNSAVLLDPDGGVRGRYDKAQLVPFGEFFPMRPLLAPFFDRYGAPARDFVAGTKPGVLSTDAQSARIGVLICYESAFGRLSAGAVRRGAGVLALLTSDQTFGTTAGPYQHADLSVLRAVETRRWLVRAASTGVSEIIDPWGRVRAHLGLGRQGTVVGDIRLRSDRTPYVRWGDWFLGVCGLIVLASIARCLTCGPLPRNGRGGTVTVPASASREAEAAHASGTPLPSAGEGKGEGAAG